MIQDINGYIWPCAYITLPNICTLTYYSTKEIQIHLTDFNTGNPHIRLLNNNISTSLPYYTNNTSIYSSDNIIDINLILNEYKLIINVKDKSYIFNIYSLRKHNLYINLVNLTGYIKCIDIDYNEPTMIKQSINKYNALIDDINTELISFKLPAYKVDTEPYNIDHTLIKAYNDKISLFNQYLPFIDSFNEYAIKYNEVINSRLSFINNNKHILDIHIDEQLDNELVNKLNDMIDNIPIPINLTNDITLNDIDEAIDNHDICNKLTTECNDLYNELVDISDKINMTSLHELDINGINDMLTKYKESVNYSNELIQSYINLCDITLPNIDKKTLPALKVTNQYEIFKYHYNYVYKIKYLIKYTCHLLCNILDSEVLNYKEYMSK